ncbi:hypothetical protein [Halalkalibacter hemicellulosilyticus]|uniref:Uncharacterized protein n=1 Tax=Halalkalibacter hemicellulosilyticusJCM 9152 TaxID=1236971 RepID=W4QLA9_9BACI|nr:hypothetical protein [Halalkalibacter hemicellulosilyticus]GAE32876.1 hypothetical protein JCM9152_4467 [Halalkalibacter hemicellulosilyticusJCM 9152]
MITKKESHMSEYSLIPPNYRKKGDPRALLFKRKKLPKVLFAQLMNEFWFYKALESLEDMANKQGFILVPTSILNWRRRAVFTEKRKVILNGRAYFFLNVIDLKPKEKERLIEFINTEVLKGGEESWRESKSKQARV